MCLAENTCPVIDSSFIGNGTINSTLVVYNTIVLLQCDEGFAFENNCRSKIIRCLDGGFWNDSILPCKGCKLISPHAAIPLFEQ